MRLARRGVRYSPGSTRRRWSVRRTGRQPGEQSVKSFRVPAEITRAVSELARSCRTTVNTVLQGAFAQLLCGLTGQHDVVFGTTVSGRPPEVVGAESMVGLMINTVPVRANITAATTTTDLLEQLQGAYNDTLDHQHLALNEIHRVAGQDKLFDTLFAFENYPIDSEALAGDHDLAITDVATRESTHYPLTLQAQPGDEIALRVEYDTDVFDADGIEALIQRLQRVLVAMTTDPARRLSSIEVLDADERARLDELGRSGGAGATGDRPVDPGVVRRTGDARPRGRGADLRGPVDDLPGTGRGRQPVGAPAGRPRCGPGTVGGAAVFAFGRGDRLDPGGTQDRGGIPAHRPRGSRGPPRFRARRRRADGRCHHGGMGEPARRSRAGGHRRQRFRRRHPTRHPAPGAGGRRHRPHHLHLGHYRCAEGRGGHPPQRHPPVRRTRRRPAHGSGSGVDAVPLAMPSTTRCGRSGVRCCTAGGWSWCPNR